MRLSPRLLSLVAGTATVASLAPLGGCIESPASAEPAPVAATAPASAPTPSEWSTPIAPGVMRPIDFEAPPPGQVHVGAAPPTPEPIVVSVAPEAEAPEAIASDEADDADEAPRTSRRSRNRDRVSPVPTPPDVISISPDWEMAAACGRG